MKITAVMLTHNSRDTVWRALVSLGKQGVPVSLLLCDNASTDGTAWWMGTDRFRRELADAGLPTMRLLPPIPSKEQMFTGLTLVNKHIEHGLAKFAWECSRDVPEALFWLDSDVVMPNGVLKRMIAAMEKDYRLGGIGVRYDKQVDHVRMGCTLYRWAPFAELAQIGFFSKGCPCRWIHQTMEKRGWTMRHLRWAHAKHLKGGRNANEYRLDG